MLPYFDYDWEHEWSTNKDSITCEVRYAIYYSLITTHFSKDARVVELADTYV